MAALPAGLKNAHDFRGYPPALSVKQGWEPYPMKRGHRGPLSCLHAFRGENDWSPPPSRALGGGPVTGSHIRRRVLGQPQPDSVADSQRRKA